MIQNFPVLNTPASCEALAARYPGKVIGLYATGHPRQNVDVLWRLRQELLKRDLPVALFFNASAKPLLQKIVAGDQDVSISTPPPDRRVN